MPLPFVTDGYRFTSIATLEPKAPNLSGQWRGAVVDMVPGASSPATAIYRTTEAVTAAEAATEIGTEGAHAARALLAAGAIDVAVLKFDTTLGGTLDAAMAAGLDFHGIGHLSGLDADTVTIDDWIDAGEEGSERRRKWQLAITETPANFSGATAVPGVLANLKHTALVVGTPAIGADGYDWLAPMGFMSAANLDNRAISGRGVIPGAKALGLDSTEGANAIANKCNTLEAKSRYDSANVMFHPGQLYTGDTISALFTKHWAERRTEAALAAAFLPYDLTGDKFPSGPEGYALIEGELLAVPGDGLAARHFKRTADLPDGYAFEFAFDEASGLVTVDATYAHLGGVSSVRVESYIGRGN